MTRRVAAIDCGTNSIRLLIADIQAGGPSPLADVAREMRIVRLGEGVDRTGRLSEAALDRTMTALSEYAGMIASAGVGGDGGAVRMVATSASRDAANAGEFTERVTAILGVAPEVISGQEEARLSFAGATRELAGTVLADEGACPPPYLVTDIGGGSTEFVLGSPATPAPSPTPASTTPATSTGPATPTDVRRVSVNGVSVNIGCVRMTERHLHGDPPEASEVTAAVKDIGAALDQVAAAVPAGQARTLVGLAGSVTTVAGIALGLDEYDSARIHHSRIPAAQVHQIAADLLGMRRAGRAAIGVMHPGRVDVIGAGALILDQIMTRFGFAEVLVSEHDILDGIAWSLVG